MNYALRDQKRVLIISVVTELGEHYALIGLSLITKYAPTGFTSLYMGI